MNARRRSAWTFGGTAAAVTGATVMARVFCPGGCQTCEACVSAVAPAGAAVLAVGTVLSTSFWRSKKRRSHEVETRDSTVSLQGQPAEGETTRAQPQSAYDSSLIQADTSSEINYS